MQRAARVAMGLVGVGLGLWTFAISACSDEAAPPIVDEDTIRWQLTSDAISFKPHAPGENAEFDVTCSISGQSVEFTITAPAVAAEMRPKSVLSVRQGNPSAGTCIVQAYEAPKVGEGVFSFQDECKGTVASGGCTLAGAFNSDGWDFNGTLTCTKLVQERGEAPTRLYDSVANGGPVVIKLDNCD